MKQCTKCKELKPKEAFSKLHRSPDGLQCACKQCQSTWRLLNRDIILKKQSIYRKEKRLQINHSIREWNIKSKFGISIAEYDSMLDRQNHSCACCGIHVSKVPRRLAIDHDHITGKIRGLLCTNCNIGIGFFKDNPKKLQQAIDYLNQERYAES